MDIKFWTKQLHDYDELMTMAQSLYANLLNDRSSTKEACNKAFLLCDAIQANRFTCQHHIIHLQMGKTHDEVIELSLIHI